MKKRVKNILLYLALFFAALSCGTIRYVPVEQKTIYTYKDSLVLKDSTILIEIPVERIKDVVPQYDSLAMETSLARAFAYVDTTTHTLKGGIENKAGGLTKTIKYVDRIMYRDSLIYREVPKEVEVEVAKIPRSYWIWLAISIISISYVAYRIFRKFKTA